MTVLAVALLSASVLSLGLSVVADFLGRFVNLRVYLSDDLRFFAAFLVLLCSIVLPVAYGLDHPATPLFVWLLVSAGALVAVPSVMPLVLMSYFPNRFDRTWLVRHCGYLPAMMHVWRGVALSVALSLAGVLTDILS